jgi:hypothetical protein
MAVRHLSSDRNLLHDTLTGRITSDRKRGLFLVVDGIAVDMEDLTRLLETHEGYEFELRIKDPVE